VSAGRPAVHPDGQDDCAELLASRIQALVDQLVGVSEMMAQGMALEAFGDLGAHLAKCAAAGQLALDSYAELHGYPCDLIHTNSTVEFLGLVK
jgi:hypothetical protein